VTYFNWARNGQDFKPDSSAASFSRTSMSFAFVFNILNFARRQRR
jgi:hypothetical protein